MRILIINYEHPPVGGGAGTASCLLARGLVRLGHTVSVVTSALGDSRGLSVEDGVRVHRIPAFRRRADRSSVGQMTCFAASAMALAPRIVRAERSEAAIAFFTLPSGLVALWLEARCRLPYVVSLRGSDVPGLDPQVKRWHQGIGRLRRAILRGARSVVANSHALADLSMATDPLPVEVIPNVVDTDTFRPADAEAPSYGRDDFQLLFAGRLGKQKNLAPLLEELARLRRDGDAGFRLHVAGDGPRCEELRELAKHLGLGESVEWHGWIDKPRLVKLYQSADCFVTTSLYEGLPNSVLEAMACGVPVVASDIPGNNNLVVDGETGLLYSLAEPRALGAALAGIKRDGDARRRMGAAGRSRAEQHFSGWQSVATAYLRLLA